jgi:hypothetical protein
MKLVCVGILAVVTLCSCGVGVDDPEGQAALLPEQQHPTFAISRQGILGGVMVVGPSAAPEAASASTSQQRMVQTKNSLGFDPTVAVPQDPIPVQPGSLPGEEAPPAPRGGGDPAPVK